MFYLGPWVGWHQAIYRSTCPTYLTPHRVGWQQASGFGQDNNKHQASSKLGKLAHGRALPLQRMKLVGTRPGLPLAWPSPTPPPLSRMIASIRPCPPPPLGGMTASVRPCPAWDMACSFLGHSHAPPPGRIIRVVSMSPPKIVSSRLVTLHHKPQALQALHHQGLVFKGKLPKGRANETLHIDPSIPSVSYTHH